MSSIAPRNSQPRKTGSFDSTVPRAQKADLFLKTKSAKRTGVANIGSTSKACLDQLIPPKRTRNRVPPPQRERILGEYAAGKSITETSKEEKRNRETVAKIVQGDEIQEHVRALRQSWFGLGPDAISAVRHSLTVQKDGRLGFQILASIGVVPSQEERGLLTAALTQEPSDEDLRVWKIVVDLMQIAAATNCVYGIPDPQLEADLKRVGGKIDEKLQRIVPIK